MALKVDVTRGSIGVYQIKLNGHLESESTPKLSLIMKEVWSDPDARFISFDMSELTFISSMGLGLLATTRKTANARHGAVVTVGMQPQIAKVFEIMKMLPKETIFTTRAEADEYLAAIQKQVVEGQQ